MSIVLIGYRGSGKTTVGRLLAQQMGWPFVDLDELIVNRAGMTIRQIFERHGEAEFRRIESSSLVEAITLKDHVISLGGGAILSPDNRSTISGSGHWVFYLSAHPAELHRRIVNDPATAANRPNLTGLGGGVEEIIKLLASREALYREVMSQEIVVAGKTVAEVCSELHRKTQTQVPDPNQIPSANDQIASGR